MSRGSARPAAIMTTMWSPPSSLTNRTLHTNDVVARVLARREKKINSDGSLPPGVKLVPFYDRTTLVDVTTSTVPA